MMNNLLSIDELVSAVKGVAVKKIESNNFVFTSVATDSRNVCDGGLFVPLVGERQDGHKYIPSAIEKGARVVFLNTTEYDARADYYNELASRYADVLFVTVADTLCALQDAASCYVEKFPSLIKVAVTGSSGKTTTKEMIASCLRQKYSVVANEGNLNSETGVPLSAFNIRAEHEIGVFEMGMNRAGEIAEIARVIKPNFALITNIGTAHVGMLGSREKIAAEKKNVFNYINENGVAFVPCKDDFEDFLSAGVSGKVVRYGAELSAADSGVKFVADKGFGGTVFSLYGVEITLPFAGSYNYHNALGAVAVARWFGVSAKQIKVALEGMAQISGRAEIENVTLKNGADVLVFKDCYNANPDSMTKAIEFCGCADTGTSKKIFVLGDMYELGNDSDDAHKKVGQEVADVSPDMAIFAGEEMKLAFSEAGMRGYKNGLFVQGSDEGVVSKIASIILDAASSGDMILLKGSRGMRLERVLELAATSVGQVV